MKRRIPFQIILGITVNKLTDEFVIHGQEVEYDYYYTSHNRTEIIETIYKAHSKLNLPKFKFSVLNEKSLKNYVTNKKDKKSNPNFTRMRTDHISQIEDFLNQRKKGKADTNHKKDRVDERALSIVLQGAIFIALRSSAGKILTDASFFPPATAWNCG